MIDLGDWNTRLAPLFADERYLKIRSFLIEEYRNYVVYPDMYDLYNCFRYTQFADLRSVLPTPITQTLKLALTDMDKKLHGFACQDAVMTGAETRTSSPVRIDRDEAFESISAKGVFPCGEGAGYAGGITSSAVDGIRVADAVFASFCRL